MQVMKRMPPLAQRWIVPPATTAFYAALPEVRRTIDANLAAVLGDCPALDRHVRSWSLLAYYAQTVSYLYALHSGAPLPVAPTFTNLSTFEDLVDKGEGVVTITGHVGAWQLLPYLFKSRKRMPPVTMAMAEEPHAGISALEASLRRQFDIVYTTGSPFVLLELHKILRQGKVVGMQFDRQVGAGYEELPFFGRPASFPIGAVVLARLARCPIVPLFACYPDGDRSRVEVVYEEPIYVAHTSDKRRDIHDALVRTVQVYESWVRRYPLQWFNFYDFWAPPDVSASAQGRRHG
jgi:lauroyl/myristoyl acyltransferase